MLPNSTTTSGHMTQDSNKAGKHERATLEFFDRKYCKPRLFRHPMAQNIATFQLTCEDDDIFLLQFNILLDDQTVLLQSVHFVPTHYAFEYLYPGYPEYHAEVARIWFDHVYMQLRSNLHILKQEYHKAVYAEETSWT
jgi:hypothetical protein